MAAVMEGGSVDTAQGFTELTERIGRLESVRHICRDAKIPIPGVVVIGEQSAGKSSVLENISGIQFPRAQNTCTRMPCVVQLATEPGVKEAYALCSMDGSFEDTNRLPVDQVEKRIHALQESHASGRSFISSRPIHVKVVRSTGPQLSLIDLPGVTHNASHMADIHSVTVELVREYVQPEEMIILCVLPAMSDFGNAEVIKLAREFDPKGARTLGVVTKCDDAAVAEHSDIVEKVTMARSTDVRLTLGFHCIVNRSQKAVERNVSREELRRKERRLFEDHHRFRGLPTDLWGTGRLIEKIARIQSAHIDECLPGIQEAVKDRLARLRRELQTLPKPLETEDEQRRFFDRVLRSIHGDFDRRMRAEFMSSEATDKAMAIAPRVADLVKEFRDTLRRENPQWVGREMVEDVRRKVQDFAHGYTVGNLIGPSVFTSLIRWKFVEEKVLSDAVEILTESIAELLHQVLAHLAQRHSTSHHPFVASRIVELAQDAVRHQRDIARTHCRAMAEAQIVTSTTSGDYMLRLSSFRKSTVEQAFSKNQQQPQQGLPPDFIEMAKRAAKDNPEELAVLETCASLQNYTEHMLDGFIEMSSKVVQHNMVFRLMEELEDRCRAAFATSAASLFPLDAASQRKRAELDQQILQLNSVRDTLAKLHTAAPPRKRIHTKA